jgi:hypoxanthine-guanine phosphoribosyltransferase
MLTTNDVAQVYDTVLSIPGMNETVKIDLKISRRNVLLLNRVIERGLTLKQDDKSTNLLDIMPEDTLQELTLLADDCLKKAGLIELSEKLKSFNNNHGK